MRILDDLRDAVRSLLKQPRFLIVTSLTLALGTWAVTAICKDRTHVANQVGLARSP